VPHGDGHGPADERVVRGPARLAPNIWFLQGFSGHGVALTGIAGQLAAEAIAGTSSAGRRWCWQCYVSAVGFAVTSQRKVKLHGGVFVQLRNALLTSALAAGMFVAQLSVAQAPPSGGPPSGQPPGTPPAAGGPPAGAMRAASKDPAAAPAGAYTLDLEHSAVIARASHGGVSFNVLRFAVKQGSLVWDATNPAKIKLEVTVNTKPITDPIVYRIKLESEPFLDSGNFPEAKFVSTAVRATGGNRYEIDGQLTLLGMTKPAQIQASFVGAGKNMEGATTLGFTGSMNVNWPEYRGAGIATSVGVVAVGLDAEFMKH
jgi:polyisoprenoid-binding protein YceI